MPSNITRHTMRHTPLYFSTFSGFNTAKTRGEHSLFDNPNAIRVDCTAGAISANGTAVVNFVKGGGGDTIYLSYFNNEISSVRLTNPPPAGVTRFTTDNLSGCKFYVDRITGSNDLIVYHANARALSPAGNQGAVHPKQESPLATAELDRLHTDAANDWAAIPHNLNLVLAGSVDKPTYNEGANRIVRHKDNTGRTRIPNPNQPVDNVNYLNKPEYVGGTVIFGFYIAGQWRFYYQTWGAVEYYRPKNAPKGWFGNRRVNADAFRLLGRGRIYPAPPYDTPLV